MRAARVFRVVVCATLATTQPARADWLLTPFVAAAVRTQTAFLDLDDAARQTHATYGAALTVIGDRLFGVDFETAFTPSAFTGGQLIVSSHVTTALGSVVVALPARWSRVVRPYAT